MRRRTVPEPIPGELARPQLVAALAGRFTRAVTVVVAGAGFGKSTSLAQAVRHNEVSPVGVDVWISCRSGDEDADRLASRILDGLDVTHGHDGDPAGAIERAIVSLSPIDVCLLFDDVHLVPDDSSGARLLADIVRRLPATGHVLVASRTVPPVPLARHRAADSVLELGEAHLAFGETEVAALAREAGRPAASVSDLGGWPALVRLGLIAPPGSDRDFLMEEVVAGLDESVRRVLLCLSVLGPAGERDVGTLLGESVDLDTLVLGAPLVARLDPDQYVAHQLWNQPLRSSLSSTVVDDIVRRGARLLLHRGEFGRAADAALSIGSIDVLSEIASAVVHRHMNHIPVDTVRPWLHHLADAPATASTRLLDALVRYTDDVRDPEAIRLIDTALDDARSTGDLTVETAALGAAAIVAHAHRDLGRLMELAERAGRLPPSDDPVLTLLRAAVPAITADLEGDPDGVLRSLESVRWAKLPVGAAQLIGRLQLQALWMTGRADESVGFADRWFGGSESYLGGLPLLSRWFAGEPVSAWSEIVGVDPMHTNDRDRLVGSCFLTMIGASRGWIAAVEQLWSDGTLESLAFDNARDSAHLTYSGAARAVLRGDDDLAARIYRRHLDRHPVTDRLGERHLRRFPAIGYVLSDELRREWDAVELGPMHVEARRSARALLAARAGEPVVDLPPTRAVITHLPLPWFLELVALLSDAGDERARPMAADLFELVGVAPLEAIAPGLSPTAQRGAVLVRSAAPDRPGEVTRIGVLGPLTLWRGGRPIDASELRRSRVRQLLAVLVVERAVTRDRAIELLWPDLPADAAAGNLRVTLTHLRKLLDPDASGQARSHHLRIDNRHIALHASERLTVDLWELEALVPSGGAEPFDLHRDLASLRNVATLFRGDPLSDLADIPQLVARVERCRLVQLDTLLRLGETSIAAGAPSDGWTCAEQALAIDTFREQAHRLSIASALRLDDATRLRRARDRLDSMLDELGVSMEASTAVLVRRADRRLER